MNKKLFYILSWTWGLPMTLIGAIVTGILMIFGKKPKRWGPCIYTEIGKNWGGLELGMFFLTSKPSYASTKDHELGHAIQNCYWGPLMPFVISIPSAIRYWYRRIRRMLGYPNAASYYDVWFELQASTWGCRANYDWNIYLEENEDAKT